MIAAIRKEWPLFYHASIGTLAAAAVLLLVLRDPAEAVIFPRCIFYSFTGLFCPGCGTQRALHALLHGDLLLALHQNALAVMALPCVAYSYVDDLAGDVLRLRLPRLYIPSRFIWTFLAILLLFWTARNIPAAPFSHLAPILT